MLAGARHYAHSGWSVDIRRIAAQLVNFRLAPTARVKIPERLSFQSDVVVASGTIYVTTRTSTYAIDARTGEQRWVRIHEITGTSPGRLGRGVAYADGKVYRGLVDGHIVAMDAKTGNVIWDVIGADVKAGEF